MIDFVSWTYILRDNGYFKWILFDQILWNLLHVTTEVIDYNIKVLLYK